MTKRSSHFSFRVILVSEILEELFLNNYLQIILIYVKKNKI